MIQAIRASSPCSIVAVHYLKGCQRTEERQSSSSPAPSTLSARRHAPPRRRPPHRLLVESQGEAPLAFAQAQALSSPSRPSRGARTRRCVAEAGHRSRRRLTSPPPPSAPVVVVRRGDSYSGSGTGRTRRIVLGTAQRRRAIRPRRPNDATGTLVIRFSALFPCLSSSWILPHCHVLP